MKKLLIILLCLIFISLVADLSAPLWADLVYKFSPYQLSEYNDPPDTWRQTRILINILLYSFYCHLLYVSIVCYYIIKAVFKKKNQSSSLKDEVNTKQTLAQDTVTMKESKKVENRLIKCSKCGKEYSNLLTICKYCKEKRPIEKTNEIKIQKKGEGEKKIRNWLIRFIIIMILWYPYYEFRFYLHSEGMSWDDISLLSIAVIGIILFISKHLTEFIISSFFKATVHINDDINQNELKNKNKKEEYPLQKTVKVWKILSKRNLIVLIFIISIPLIYMGIKQKERKDLLSTIEKAEHQSLILSEEKKRIANEKRREALKTKSADLEHKKEKLENSVSDWESNVNNLKSQIKNIKLKYGSWDNNGNYRQHQDFSLADKQALRELLKEGDKLEYERLGLQSRQKTLLYDLDRFDLNLEEKYKYKYFQVLQEIINIGDDLEYQIMDLFSQKELISEEKITIIKNAEYYFDLADSRMKSKPNWGDDMTNDDWLYQVENINLCLELDPNYWDAYIVRGTAYYELGEYKKSLKDFKKAKKDSPDEFLWVIYTGIGNAKLYLNLNYCKEYKKACNLGYCEPYNEFCK